MALAYLHGILHLAQVAVGANVRKVRLSGLSNCSSSIPLPAVGGCYGQHNVQLGGKGKKGGIAKPWLRRLGAGWRVRIPWSKASRGGLEDCTHNCYEETPTVNYRLHLP